MSLLAMLRLVARLTAVPPPPPTPLALPPTSPSDGMVMCTRAALCGANQASHWPLHELACTSCSQIRWVITVHKQPAVASGVRLGSVANPRA